MKNEFVYNPVGFNGHSHAATIVEHKSEIYLSWYVYEDKEHEKGQIVIAKYNKATHQWPKASFTFEDMSTSSFGNPVLCSTGESLILYFVILKNGYWDSAQVYSSTLDEDLNKWSLPAQVNTELGIMIRHRPLCFDNYAIIPAYDEKDMSTVLYQFDYSSPCQWREYSRFKGEYIQGDLLAYSPKEIQMYLRAAGNNTKVMKTLSANGGKDWDIARETSLHCPLSGVAAIKLDSGNILVSNNNTPAHKRTPISLSLSQNKGLNFELGSWDIDSSNIELSYPTLLQDSSGLIHLAFTFNRKMIKHVTMTEEELLQRVKGYHA